MSTDEPHVHSNPAHSKYCFRCLQERMNCSQTTNRISSLITSAKLDSMSVLEKDSFHSRPSIIGREEGQQSNMLGNYFEEIRDQLIEQQGDTLRLLNDKLDRGESGWIYSEMEDNTEWKAVISELQYSLSELNTLKIIGEKIQKMSDSLPFPSCPPEMQTSNPSAKNSTIQKGTIVRETSALSNSASPNLTDNNLNATLMSAEVAASKNPPDSTAYTSNPIQNKRSSPNRNKILNPPPNPFIPLFSYNPLPCLNPRSAKETQRRQRRAQSGVAGVSSPHDWNAPLLQEPLKIFEASLQPVFAPPNLLSQFMASKRSQGNAAEGSMKSSKDGKRTLVQKSDAATLTSDKINTHRDLVTDIGSDEDEDFLNERGGQGDGNNSTDEIDQHKDDNNNFDHINPMDPINAITKGGGGNGEKVKSRRVKLVEDPFMEHLKKDEKNYLFPTKELNSEASIDEFTEQGTQEDKEIIQGFRSSLPPNVILPMPSLRLCLPRSSISDSSNFKALPLVSSLMHPSHSANAAANAAANLQPASTTEKTDSSPSKRVMSAKAKAKAAAFDEKKKAEEEAAELLAKQKADAKFDELRRREEEIAREASRAASARLLAIAGETSTTRLRCELPRDVLRTCPPSLTGLQSLDPLPIPNYDTPQIPITFQAPPRTPVLDELLGVSAAELIQFSNHDQEVSDEKLASEAPQEQLQNTLATRNSLQLDSSSNNFLLNSQDNGTLQQRSRRSVFAPPAPRPTTPTQRTPVSRMPPPTSLPVRWSPCTPPILTAPTVSEILMSLDGNSEVSHLTDTSLFDPVLVSSQGVAQPNFLSDAWRVSLPPLPPGRLGPASAFGPLPELGLAVNMTSDLFLKPVAVVSIRKAPISQPFSSSLPSIVSNLVLNGTQPPFDSLLRFVGQREKVLTSVQEKVRSVVAQRRAVRRAKLQNLITTKSKNGDVQGAEQLFAEMIANRDAVEDDIDVFSVSSSDLKERGGVNPTNGEKIIQYHADSPAASPLRHNLSSPRDDPSAVLKSDSTNLLSSKEGENIQHEVAETSLRPPAVSPSGFIQKEREDRDSGPRAFEFSPNMANNDIEEPSPLANTQIASHIADQIFERLCAHEEARRQAALMSPVSPSRLAGDHSPHIANPYNLPVSPLSLRYSPTGALLEALYLHPPAVHESRLFMSPAVSSSLLRGNESMSLVGAPANDFDRLVRQVTSSVETKHKKILTSLKEDMAAEDQQQRLMTEVNGGDINTIGHLGSIFRNVKDEEIVVSGLHLNENKNYTFAVAGETFGFKQDAVKQVKSLFEEKKTDESSNNNLN